eukprot:COSAG02_NODE_2162_length_9623_cov_3.592923_5_plen_607_part_00
MIYHLFDDPEWFKQMGVKGYPLYMTGMIIVWTVNLLIILSTFAFCLESLPAFCTEKDTGRCNNEDPEFYATLWLIIEAGCVLVFTGDFLARMVCCIIMGKSDFQKFRGDPMNYVDVVAVFPFYIQLLWSWLFPATCTAWAAVPVAADVAACAAVSGAELDDNSACLGVMGSVLSSVSVCTYVEARQVIDLRFVRVIRLARVLRSLPDKYAGMGGIVMDILRTAAMPLILPLYFMFLGCIVFASMAYYVEAPVNEICYFDGDTSNGATCGVDDIPGVNCNKITGWSSLRDSVGNAGCLTDGGCGCGCDSTAHVYNRARLYYSSCRTHGTTSSDLAAEFETIADAPSCESWQTKSESETLKYLPNVTGECTGVITYETWDRNYHAAEYSSDMFADGSPGGIFTAMWWCVVTFTTVGYGDMNPRTPQGQIVAIFTMMTGVFFLAMPLAVVGGSFHSAWSRAEAEFAVAENAKMLAQAKKDGRELPPAMPSARELVAQNYGDKSERALQEIKGYITAILAKSEHLRELAGGLEEHPEIWAKFQSFQLEAKLASRKLGDKSTIVTESFVGDDYQARDENGELLWGARGNWWGHIPEHVSERSQLAPTKADD